MKDKKFYLKFTYLFALIVTIAVIVNVFLVAIFRIHPRSLTSLSSYVDSVSMMVDTIYGERGNIYDNNGQIVAQNENTYDIICYLSKNRKGNKNEIAYVDDPLYASQVLANILNTDQAKIFELLTANSNLYQTELGTAGRNLSITTVEKIKEDKNLHGIGFKVSTKRVYPLANSFSPYLLGFARSDENGKLVGKMGVEAYLNEELSGLDGKHVYQADKHGYVLPGMYEETIPATKGDNVYLTLDASIQEALNDSFEEIAKENGAIKIWAAVMDIESGKLLGYGQYPSFNPNYADIEDYNNYLSQYAYEPGSVLKAIIYAAAMDSGVYDGNAYFDSSPFCFYAGSDNIPYRVYSDTNYGCINNAGNKNWGSIPLDDGLILSSNVATSTLLTQYLDSPLTFEKYLKAFGFFNEVNTDGLYEVSGKKNYYYASEKLALTYGQGSSVTTLQLLQAYSAIFGNGEMVKPYYIDKIVNDSGDIVYQGQRQVSGKPISESTAKQMQALLERVVSDPSGTAQFYGIDEVKVAAKTGTSEIALIGQGYQSDMAISSVMMAFPAEKPKTMIYYAYIAPYDYYMHTKSKPINYLTRKVYYLTSTNTRPAAENPDITSTSSKVPDLINKELNEANAALNASSLTAIVIGNGNKVLDQYPKYGENIRGGSKVFLLTSKDDIILRDFTGWTRKDLLSYAYLANLNFEIEGSGVVYEQSVEANTTIHPKDTISFKLKNIESDLNSNNPEEE